MRNKGRGDWTAAAWALGSLGSEAKPAIPALVALLDAENQGVRQTAATVLWEIGPEAIPVIVASLKDANGNVRRGRSPRPPDTGEPKSSPRWPKRLRTRIGRFGGPPPSPWGGSVPRPRLPSPPSRNCSRKRTRRSALPPSKPWGRSVPRPRPPSRPSRNCSTMTKISSSGSMPRWPWARWAPTPRRPCRPLPSCSKTRIFRFRRLPCGPWGRSAPRRRPRYRAHCLASQRSGPRRRGQGPGQNRP